MISDTFLPSPLKHYKFEIIFLEVEFLITMGFKVLKRTGPGVPMYDVLMVCVPLPSPRCPARLRPPGQSHPVE